MPARKRSAASPRGAAGVGAALARKNPLRVAGDPVPVVGSAAAVAAPVRLRTAYTPREMRQMMISEFGDWLRTQTNKQRRPFQEETVQAYTAAALTLSAWMEAEGVSGDFTACDTGVLNRFFRWYYEAHSQGGTNTKQRNLRHLFSWLATAYGHLHPYTDALVRCAPRRLTSHPRTPSKSTARAHG
jgi:integrase/recombinase XerD